ncbi:GNAT family N-acetyltransferase [Thioclava sp. BHET1]|nr:GNAT family N-acetyltransferase [Thioclava sp. BHET1]
MTGSALEIAPFPGAAWQQALDAIAPGGACAMQQSQSYGTVLGARGRRVARFEIRADGVRIGLVQMIGRRGMWLISRGPVFVPGCAEGLQRRALCHLARRPGLVLATPAAAVAGPGLIPLITARHHAIWSLRADPSALRKGLAGKWRNRLVAAERAGLRVRPEPEFDWILRADQAQQRARGYRALPADFTRDWAAQAPEDLIALRIEDATGARIAGVIVLRHGAGASYHIGWSGAQGRASGAHNLALWQTALMLRAKGVVQFDLGCVDGEAGAGRLHFKLGTGARAVSLGASLLALPI